MIIRSIYGETPDGTLGKRANNTKYWIKKKHSDALNSIHLSVIFLGFMSQPDKVDLNW